MIFQQVARQQILVKIKQKVKLKLKVIIQLQQKMNLVIF